MNTLANVFHPNALLRQMDRAFSDLLGESAGPASRGMPPINAFEDDTAVIIEAELPGFKLDQVELTWERPTLTLRGTRAQGEPENAKFVHRERAFGEFTRAIRIGREIDATGITAKMTDGVLTVRLPKASQSQPKKISIGVQNN